jgi:hypothetical protein
MTQQTVKAIVARVALVSACSFLLGAQAMLPSGRRR